MKQLHNDHTKEDQTTSSTSHPWKNHRNEQGLTLVELLAAFTISTFVILMIIGLTVLVQKQFHSQAEGSQQLTDITIATKIITKGIRTHEVIETSDGIIEFWEDEAAEGTPDLSLELVDDVLQKNGKDYMYDIEVFEVRGGSEDGYVALEIANKKGKHLETEIKIR